MVALLAQEWRARRVAVLDADVYPGNWVCALLRALGVQVLPVKQQTPLTQEYLYRLLCKRRPCAVIVPTLRASGDVPQAFRQLDALHLLLSEGRECGLRMLLLLSPADTYIPQSGMRLREDDPIGGANAQGGIRSLLELYALGFSRGLYGDPTSVIIARHPPLTGGGMDDSSFQQRWCAALSQGEIVSSTTPGMLYPFMHPLEAVGGALLCGAKLLRHGTAYTGAWNFAPDITGLCTCRAACSLLREYAGSHRPIIETTDGANPPFPVPDDHRAREKLDYRSAFSAAETLSMLYDYHISADIAYTLEAQTERYLRALE